MKTPYIHRRRFLGGSLCLGASAGLLAPLLQQAEAAATQPRRFVFLVAGNGIETTTLTSDATRTAINDAGGSIDPETRVRFWQRYAHTSPVVTTNAELTSAFALASLAPGQGQRDLASRSAVVLGLSSKVAGGGHTSGYGALSSTNALGTVPAGPSIDAWLANSPCVTDGQPFDAVRLGVLQSTQTQLQYGICAFDRRKPAPVVVNSTSAFNMLFGSVASDAGQRTFTRRGELLDYSRNDIQTALSSFSGNSDERAKLERYIQSLEELRARQDLLVAGEDNLRAVKPADPTEDPRYLSEAPLERLQTQFELARAALIGNLTNVVVLTCGASGGFNDMRYQSLDNVFRESPNYNGVINRHTVCHESGGNAAYRNVLHAVTASNVQMLAELARHLDAVPEAGGTMLDNTVLVYLSDNGDDHHSQGLEWPALLIGGNNMGLKTDGRSVVYPAPEVAEHRQLSNLFNTLGYAAGEELDEFGLEGTTRVAPGPLPELLG